MPAARIGMRHLVVMALAVGLGLAGCATPQVTRLRAEPPAALPPRAELTGVAFFPQKRYQCGPAALATVLDDAGHRIAPDALVTEVYLPAREGSLQSEMRAAIRTRNLVAYPLAGQLEDVLQEIAAGHPVLVLQNLGLSWLPRWHYAVAVGYDLPAGEIVLRSGRMRRRVTPLSTFDRTWARSDRWAQVIAPADHPPVTADAVTWLGAVRELETTGAPEAARRGYRAATQRWPSDEAAWMARGNAAYAADDMQRASSAFRRAVQLAPEQPAGWNNLAYALSSTNRGQAAIDAAECAVHLAPQDPGPKATLKEIRARAGHTGNGAADLPICPTDSAERR